MSSEHRSAQDRGPSIASTMLSSSSISTGHSTSQHEDDGTEALTPQVSHTSRPSSRLARTRTATSIGTQGTSPPEFEIDWDGDDDPENPRNWPIWYKSMLIGFISWSTWVVVLYSTSYTTGTEQMMEEFNVHSTPLITLGVTVYLVGLAIGSLVLAPISEMYGRKPVYVIAMFGFMVLIIPCGLASSLEGVLVTRFFGALCGSAMIAHAPGTISDIVTDEYRALAFSVWSIGPLNGPVFGPVIGGFITQYLGFRFANWVVMMCAAVAWIMVMILKETYSPALLNKRAAQRRKETDDPKWWCRYEQKLPFWQLMSTNLTRPFIMAVTEPICIFWNLYIATIYGILYLCFVAYPIIFSEIRGWSTGISGLAFVGIGTGTLLIIALEPLIRRMINAHKHDPSTNAPQPEATVSIVCIAAILSPIGQLWFAWTCIPPVHWVWPILAGIPFGAGNSLIFIYCSSYLTGAYGIYTASALAGNAVVRSLIGGTLPLAGPAMYANLGPHWAGTLLGVLQVVLIPIPLVFYKYGAGIRAKSALIAKLRHDQDRLQGKRARIGEKKNAAAAEGGKDLECGAGAGRDGQAAKEPGGPAETEKEKEKSTGDDKEKKG